MQVDEIRKLAIIAMFFDDELLDRLVLKGGNALDLVHRIGGRTSVDIDFSMEDDFTDIEDISNRVQRCLDRVFNDKGFEVFDYKFAQKPKVNHPDKGPKWGGYKAEFKLSPLAHTEYGLEKKRRESVTVGPNFQRKFTIDISKFEYCAAKEEHEIDDYTIYVYTLPMIAIEKLRALCQQMEEYTKSKGRARARDIYDICIIVEHGKFSFSSYTDLIKLIFAAKDVPVHLLQKLPSQREFHRSDWNAVTQSVNHSIESYDTYYNRLIAMIEGLDSLWVEDVPS